MLNRRSLSPDRLFDLARHRYLVDIYNETADKVVLLKAGQVGASEYLISYALHACDSRGATALYVFPTDKHVSDFSLARIGPAIEASDYLRSAVVAAHTSAGQRGADRVTLKRVGNRFLYLRGGRVATDGSASQLKSVDADVLVLDELDEMDPRAPAIARKRLGHSDIAEERTASTPTYPGLGIHAEWQQTDQRQWHVRCDGCGEWQPLTIGQVVIEWDQLERPVAWHGQEMGQAWVACHKCGGRLNRLSPGQWVAEQSGAAVRGYQLTKLFAGNIEVLDIVTALQSTDETTRKECYNQDLGLPYRPRGTQIDDTVLDDCQRDYAHRPVQGERTIMGLDVGKVLHAVIRGPQNPETGERPQRWAGELASWDDVGPLMRRYRVGRLVVDALPETTKARELQSAHRRGVVWLAYYVSQKIGTKRAEPVQWDVEQGVVNLDRTRMLDQTFARFAEEENTLPANAKDIPDYYTHMKAQVRVLEDGPGGQKVARYVGTGPDHLGHAENYCTVASLQRQRKVAGVLGARR